VWWRRGAEELNPATGTQRNRIQLTGPPCNRLAAAYSNLIDRQTTRTQKEEQISKRSSRIRPAATMSPLTQPQTQTRTNANHPQPKKKSTSSTPYNKQIKQHSIIINRPPPPSLSSSSFINITTIRLDDNDNKQQERRT